jgi:hypothetical protein
MKLLGVLTILTACSSGITSLSPPPDGGAIKSAKRGVAYDFKDPADLAALSPGISWWYDWSPTAHVAPANGVEFVPMMWNFDYDFDALAASLKGTTYLLVLNEPMLTSQANLTPQAAAAQWPKYEALAQKLGAKIVGPQITYGDMPTYGSPTGWMDAFIAAYRSANGRDPQFDYLGFHWYDYGLASQLDSLKKYGKPVWVTEFANTNPNIQTLSGEESQMTEMVNILETRSDVFRYSWFTGRWSSDPHYASLLAAGAGQASDLGKLYLTLP